MAVKSKHAIVLLAVLAFAPAIAYAQDASDAFVNDDARELLRLVRARRITVDRRIEAYETIARERFSVGVQASIANKLAYRRETVSRIDWRREGPVRMAVLAMRAAAPLFDTKAQVPEDISAELLRLAFDPAGSDMLLRVDSGTVRHPLIEGSERYYRFEAGATTVISLPDGRSIRLRELRFQPRQRDPRLIAGSFWVESETHAIVQAYFRLARAFEADRDGRSMVAVSTEPDRESGQADKGVFTLSDIPGFLGPVRADIDHVAIEYGLYDETWWLPRLMVVRGIVQINRFRIPLVYERTYDPFTVHGDTTIALGSVPDSLPRGCREQVRFAISAEDPARDSARQARIDSERARRERWEDERRAMRGDTAHIARCTREFIISAPRDSVLLHSAELPAEYAGDVELLSDDDLQKIGEYVRALPGAPWRIEPARLKWGLGGPGLVRYNRIEALAAGARQSIDLGPATLELEARFGTADREVRGELTLERNGTVLRSRLGGYRRLQPTTPSASAHGTLASLGALLFGRDDLDYFDAAGAELVVQPPASRAQGFDLRLYAERQRAVERNTDFSIAHLIDSDHTFRGNFAADAAEQFGARLRLRKALGLNPAAPRVAGELSLGGETGDYTFLRPEALLRVQSPLPLGLSLAVEGAAGTIEGHDTPAQALWRLGGASTLRGYPGNTLSGERYWRTRTELGTGIPAAELILFSDAGWAGSNNTFDSNGARHSVGIGGSFLDGLIRVDIARGLRAPGGWRLHLHFTSIGGN